MVWDAQTGEIIRSLKGHAEMVNSVSWSPNSKRLASASSDGSVVLWNSETGQLLLQLIMIGSDWIGYTPQGYYHGSLAAEQFIRWRIPGEKGEWPRLVAASQFRATFYRPDLFRHLLAEGDVARALGKADSDGKRIRDAFFSHGKALYDDIPKPIVLFEEDATREKILDAVQEFGERMTKNDVGIIFFAGHGDKFNDRLYLAAHDTQKTRLVRTGISASQLRDTLAGTKGRKYFFVDACHAGGVFQRGDASVHEDFIREMRTEATGMVIAAACRDNEVANEDEKVGGYFSHALAEGLSGKAANFRGVIYPKHLKVYVEDRLKELTKPLKASQQQRPLFDGPEELMDLPLVKPKP